MSLAPRSYTSLCSSPPLSRTASPKQNPALLCQIKYLSSKNYSFSSNSISFCNTQLVKPSNFVVKASETEPQTSKSKSGSEGEEQFEEYEVELDQPYGLKFAKGRDGGTYIDAIAPGGSADKTKMFTVGDKVLATRLFFPLFFLINISLPKFLLD